MDDAVQRFRRQAGRELGDREGAERRYSLELRQQAVAYWRAREAAGDGLRTVATTLGIARLPKELQVDTLRASAWSIGALKVLQPAPRCAPDAARTCR